MWFWLYIYTSICQIISIVAISTCAEVSMIFSCYQKGEPAGSIADQYHCLIGWMTEGMTEWWNYNMKLWIGLNWLHLQVNIPYWRNWWNGTKRMTLFFPSIPGLVFIPLEIILSDTFGCHDPTATDYALLIIRPTAVAKASCGHQIYRFKKWKQNFWG